MVEVMCDVVVSCVLHLLVDFLYGVFVVLSVIEQLFECSVVLVAAPELACNRWPVRSAHKHKELIRGLQNFP